MHKAPLVSYYWLVHVTTQRTAVAHAYLHYLTLLSAHTLVLHLIHRRFCDCACVCTLLRTLLSTHTRVLRCNCRRFSDCAMTLLDLTELTSINVALYR
jgi:hypothetical protein